MFFGTSFIKILLSHSRSIEHIRRANGALNRNPNESLLLQGLLVSLSDEET